MPIIPVLGREGKGNQEFEASLGYMKSWLKKGREGWRVGGLGGGERERRGGGGREEEWKGQRKERGREGKEGRKREVNGV